MVVLEKTPVDAEATPLQSVNATLYQLDRHVETRRDSKGVECRMIPVWAVRAIQTWLREAAIQLTIDE